jgi:polysaccharide pyruvyl transferase WcaK-like protein
MNIGLLTYYRHNNFGLFWQAVSTLRSLENIESGIKSYLVPIKQASLLYDLRTISKYHVLKSSKRNLAYIRARARYLHKYIPKGSIGRYDIDALRLLSEDLNLDLMLTGADTCLDIGEKAAQENIVPSYWLPRDIVSITGFLSSSCGGLVFDKLSETTLLTLRNRINSLSYHYVRDRMTSSLLQQISPTCNPAISPDPAFAIFSSAKIKANKSDSSGKPLCLFNLEPTLFNRNLVSILEDSYRIVSTNRRALLPAMDTSFVGPEEHLMLIAKADLLVTTSFHEAMAAAALGTPYIAVERCVTMGRRFGMTKLSDLCIRLESQDSYLDPENPKLSDPHQLRSNVSGLLSLPSSRLVSRQQICEGLAEEFQSICSKIVTDAQGRLSGPPKSLSA